jgi:flagellar protein FliO/FliZ
MDALFGSNMPLAARFFIAFLVVLALIGVTAWLVRRFSANRLGGGARGRQPRLAVIDAASVDGRRRLVLIRRDNTEHLLMIGGPTDVVIEPNIVRATGAREVAREPGRISMQAETTARLAPVEPSFQLPQSEPPAAPAPPAPPPRPSYRAPATEEPWLPPEPGGRARPTDSLTGLAAELSAKLHSPELVPPPPPARSEPPAPPRTAAPPVTPEQPPAPAQNDHNLAEMAQQLEAALRRAPTPEGRPPVTDPLAVTPPLKPAPPRATPREFKPRPEAKFEPKREARFEPAPERRPESRAEPKRESRPEPKFELKLDGKPEPKLDSKFDNKFEARPEPKFKFEAEPKPEAPTAPDKNIYDNLEEEMASLLGRPPDKS